MADYKRSLSPRYGIPVVGVALALLLTLLLHPLVEQGLYSQFFLAVMISAWYGGLGPGLFATVLSALSLDYFFIFPIHEISFDFNAFLRLAVFLLIALLTSSFAAARRRVEDALKKAHDELEKRVEERTAELKMTNERLQGEIAERNLLAKELNVRNQELLRLQGEVGRVERLAAMGKVAGTVAHELGTPLNSVLGYAQLLAEENLPESARGRLKIVQTQVQRMIDIINQLLSRARGYVRPHHRVDVNKLVVETIEILNPIFRQHSIDVKTTLQDSLPLMHGDEYSLQRILINVLDNAIDAMENGGQIAICTREDLIKPGLIVEITDTGMGIPPEILPNIFDFFVTTKAPGQGTGLGLSVCQEILKGHGGSINISSQVGKGTSVSIFLPVTRAGDQSVVAIKMQSESR